MSPLVIQRALLAQGYDLGPSKADGIWGRASIKATKLFQGDHGLKIDGVVGGETLKALGLVGALPLPAVESASAPPMWLHEAGRLMGTREIAGAKSNPVIIGWATRLGGWIAGFYKNDDTPWCGLFVAHCIGATLPDEKLPSNPLSALAWKAFGVPLAKPRLGAVAVFKRPGGGHVGFYLGEDATTVTVRGGNQSNAVTETRIPKSRLVGYRWPATVPLTGSGGPIEVASKGEISTNEA